MGLADSIIGVESGGDPDAKNSRSSASGPGQFIDSTFLSVLRQHHPDIAEGQSDADLLKLKNDPVLGRQLTDDYAGDNQGTLRQAGLPVTPGTTYLAHFAGPSGAVGLLNADPSAPAASVLGQGFAKANPTLAGYSAGQLAAWADRKMGGATAAPMSFAGPQPAASAPAPQAQPSQPAPQQAAPVAAAAAAPSITPEQIAAMSAVPGLQNILPARPNIFGLKTAPFSLARS